MSFCLLASCMDSEVLLSPVDGMVDGALETRSSHGEPTDLMLSYMLLIVSTCQVRSGQG